MELVLLQRSCAINDSDKGGDDPDRTLSDDGDHTISDSGDDSDSKSEDLASDEPSDETYHLFYTASGKVRRQIGDWDPRLSRENGVMPIFLFGPAEACMERLEIFPPMRSAVRAICDAFEPSTSMMDFKPLREGLGPLLNTCGEGFLEKFLEVYLSGFTP
jgi:hypothetical protein